MESINSFLQPIDFIVVVIYLVVLIGIGYWVSFIKKREEGENLFLAGHSLGWSSIGLTMWGTNVGPSMLIASASIGYTTGVVAGNFGWYAFVFIFLLAMVFAPRYLGAHVQTLPEFMGKRFGQSTRNILAWYTLITILISWLALTLFAGGILVGQILNLPLWISVIILVMIAAFFTIAGGLKAIAYTNVFQMGLLIAVSLILTVVGVVKAGGPMAIFENTPSHYWNLLLPADDPNYPWLAIILGYPVMGVWFWCTDQSMVQSVLGAKNLKQGQLGANFTGWLKILDVALFIIPGITCFVLFPNLSNPDEAYMTMVTRLLPSGMIGMVMAVLIAALVSTIDSALNSLSTVFTMDIYVKKHKPDATQKQIITIGRIVTVLGAAISIVLTLAIDSIKGLNLFDIFQAILGFIAPPMAVVFLFGVLWKRTTTRAVNFTLSVGTIISIGTGIFYLWIFPKEQYTFWPHFLLLSFFIFVFLAVLTFLISLSEKEVEARPHFDYGDLGRPDRKVLWLWAALIVVMIGLYVLFNGH
ncbi:sodium:solute symporter [Gaoshiqia sediminis]|uniref:Sodium:solute symporter n=1 Tax=Gaoshiqia sediminis TaxID=2986998 RepID=A0AA41Y634_9BACT|nr:sodium:solute symporter [Gaoshiqia sediminis]MCW0481807.1 sodium:solute symporter [Gaoshiqia sediminis]